MKVNQFTYRQNTGVATMFKAESDEEAAILEVLRILIDEEDGALSRKCFTFDMETGTMSMDIEKYTNGMRRKRSRTTSAKVEQAAGPVEETATQPAQKRKPKTDK